jgi:uncharacterized protein YoxC
MQLLLEICAVVATLAVVTIAVATVRAMLCAERITEDLSKLTGEVREWIGEVNGLTRETRETVASVRDLVVPIRRVAERFGTLGERTADLSIALLEEVGPLLRTVVAVVSGARAGTALLRRLFHQFTRGRSAANGGSDNE